MAIAWIKKERFTTAFIFKLWKSPYRSCLTTSMDKYQRILVLHACGWNQLLHIHLACHDLKTASRAILHDVFSNTDILEKKSQ